MKTLFATTLALSTIAVGQLVSAAGHSGTFVFDRISAVQTTATAIVGYSHEAKVLFVATSDDGAIAAIDLSDPATPTANGPAFTLDQSVVENSAIEVGAHQGHPMVFVSSETGAGFTVYEASNPENLVMLADPTATDTGAALDIEYIPASVSPGEQPLITVVDGQGDVIIYQLNQ